jgi:hypothetical protein
MSGGERRVVRVEVAGRRREGGRELTGEMLVEDDLSLQGLSQDRRG